MSKNPSPDVEHDAVTIGAETRTFTVLGPRSDAPGRALVLVFHGSKQSADVHRRFTGDALAPLAEQKAVVVYLDGYRGNWNDARRHSSFPARLHGIDDVAFTRAVVERVTASHGTDPRRIVLVGYSNGGQMVLRLLHEAPELGSAAVIIAATMPVPEDFLFAASEPARPASITLVHGTRDRIAPYAGGTMSRWAQTLFKVGGRTLSAPQTAAYFAHRNGIRSAPLEQAVPAKAANRRTAVAMTSFDGEALPRVVLYTVHGGGHTIPGPHASPRILGRTAADVTLLALVDEAISAIDAG